MGITTETEYEEHLLREIRGLPQSEIPKILKLIHFFKDEILELEKRKEEDQQLFWDSFGSWKDDRPPEEIIEEIYATRKSTDRDIQL